MDKTLRERLDDYQNEMLNKNLVPDRAAIILTELSSLYGNVNDRILETDLAYNRVLKDALDINEKTNRATIQAKTTDEYKQMMIAKNTEKELLALIRSLNRFLKVKEDELRTVKYQ